jgi:hypothetical protein
VAPPLSGFDWERQQLAGVEQAQSYLSEMAEQLGARGVLVRPPDAAQEPAEPAEQAVPA